MNDGALPLKSWKRLVAISSSLPPATMRQSDVSIRSLAMRENRPLPALKQCEALVEIREAGICEFPLAQFAEAFALARRGDTGKILFDRGAA